MIDKLITKYATWLVNKRHKNAPKTIDTEKEDLNIKISMLAAQVDKAIDDYNTLLNGISTMVWYCTDPETYGASNSAFLEFYGLTSDSVYNKNIKDVLSPNVYEHCLDENIRVFATGEVIKSEQWHIRHDGVPRLLSITKRPKKNGKVHYIIGSADDITDEYNYSCLYQAILQSQSDCIVRYDINRKVVYANKAYSRLFCGTDDIIKCNTIIDFFQDIPDEDVPIAQKCLEDVQSPPYHKEVIHRIVTYDDEVRLFHWQVTGILDPNDKVYQVQCVGRDITIQKEAELDLNKHQILLKTILDNLPIGIAVNATKEGSAFEYLNDNFAKFYRFNKKYITTTDDFWEQTYKDPEFREKIKAKVLADCASNDPARMEWHNVPIEREGEDTTYVSAKNVIVPDTPLMLSTVWDVTERRRLEDSLRESVKKYEDLVENISDTIYTIDTEGILTYISQSITENAGYTKEEVVGKSFLTIVHPDDKRERMERYNATLRGDSKLTEFRIVKKDGGILWVRNNARPLYKGKNIVGIYGIFHNINDRKIREDELKSDYMALRTIFDNATSSVFVSLAGKCIDQNETARQEFGYTDKEAIGRCGTDWIIEADRPMVLKNMLDGYEDPYYVTALRKDGSTFPCEIQGRAFELNGNRVRMTVLRNISDRNRPECTGDMLKPT